MHPRVLVQCPRARSHADVLRVPAVPRQDRIEDLVEEVEGQDRLRWSDGAEQLDHRPEPPLRVQRGVRQCADPHRDREVVALRQAVFEGLGPHVGDLERAERIDCGLELIAVGRIEQPLQRCAPDPVWIIARHNARRLRQHASTTPGDESACIHMAGQTHGVRGAFLGLDPHHALPDARLRGARKLRRRDVALAVFPTRNRALRFQLLRHAHRRVALSGLVEPRAVMPHQVAEARVQPFVGEGALADRLACRRVCRPRVDRCNLCV
mmetsp:Transcript_49429/g.116476  ORF Transcript_49429/g.116476 Transcript_49429/m.116476 type:complete len:266 (-) Transcript_49429:1396-2193(-)